jgi:hypothetical protein
MIVCTFVLFLVAIVLSVLLRYRILITPLVSCTSRWLFVLCLLAIVLSVHLRYTDSYYPFGSCSIITSYINWLCGLCIAYHKRANTHAYSGGEQVHKYINIIHKGRDHIPLQIWFPQAGACAVPEKSYDHGHAGALFVYILINNAFFLIMRRWSSLYNSW